MKNRVVRLLLLGLSIGGLGARFASGSERVCAGSAFRGGAGHSAFYCGEPVASLSGVRWRFETEGPVRSSPVVAENVLYFGSADQRLYALDAASGRELWRFAADGGIGSSPAVAGDLVFFESGDRFVHAVEKRTGAERWRFAIGKDLPFDGGFDYHESSPLPDRGGLYVGGGDGGIYALDAASGRLRWRFQTGGRVRSSPSSADGVVYVGSMDGVLYALDETSGKLRWKHATEGASLDLAKWGFDRRSINSSPAVADGVVTFGSRDAHQYALDARTGKLLWRLGHPVAFTPDHAELAWVEGAPAIADGVTYVGSSDGHFVNAVELRSGRELWRHATPGRVLSSPAIAGNLLYVGGDDGAIFALDRGDGHLVWSYSTPEMVYSSPVVAGGVVYAGSDDGALYALAEAKSGGPFLPWKSVYFDDKLSGWIHGGKAVADGLQAAGYQLLDAATLPGFLAARSADRVASVVVFASDQAPAAVTAGGEGKPSPIDAFLRSGGRIVWIGIYPFSLKFDEATGKPSGVDPSLTKKILGVGPEAMSPGSIEEVASLATAEGREWGLPPTGIASMPVDPRDVTIVLARDSQGLANAWVKALGRGQFVRLWGRQRPLRDLEWLRRIAEHGLAPGQAEGAR